MTTFAITRTDGRCNVQVILDYVRGADAEHVFSYHELGLALSVGSDRDYGTVAVQHVVAQSYVALLKDQQRALHSVRGVGYRLAAAREHMRLARTRQRRADVQLRKGMATLANVKWDEMDSQTRAVHQGTLMVVSAIYANQQGMEKRLSRTEELIAELMRSAQGTEAVV